MARTKSSKADGAEFLVLKEFRATADKCGWRAVMTDLSLVRLHDAKAAHIAFMAYQGTDDAILSDLCGAQAESFWALVDTKPSSIIGALETARFMLALHKAGVAPDLRDPEDSEPQDIPALALEIILSAFGAEPQQDPAVAGALQVWASKEAWAEMNDAQIGTPAEKRAASSFNDAVEALAYTTPTSAMGAGMMAQVMSWCAMSESVDKRQLRNTLASIADAFAPPREEEMTEEAIGAATSAAA